MKAPFPYFGGKTDAAPLVWSAMGRIGNYVEPFMGSLAVLLNRPTEPDGSIRGTETVNDADGLLVNAWRSIALKPDETAEAATWPVSEADLTARHLALVKWKAERNIEALCGDPLWCDPQMAGWWIWGACSWIGSGWCSGRGPWAVGEDGRLARRDGDGAGVERKRPHLGDDGQGIHKPAISRKRPHLGDDGQGIHKPSGSGCTREWFQQLQARLSRVRICCGSWERVCTNSVLFPLMVRKPESGEYAGVFLDPPYADTAGRDSNLYAHDDLHVAHTAREWALEAGKAANLRVVFAGFHGEHGEAFLSAGWREVEWFKAGFLKGGLSNQAKTANPEHETNQHRERLWLSPACLSVEDRQAKLF